MRKQISSKEDSDATSTPETQQAVPTGTWNADPVHSTIGFAVKYMSGTFQGTFSKVEAVISDGTLRGSADVASVQVKDENMEAHLQSPDFFDAERTPQITFESSDISRSGDDVKVAGEITIKGHTEPIDARGHVSDPIGDPFGGERFGLQLETTIDRTKFGLNWNNPLPTGDPALSNEVTIMVDLQLVQAGG